jgi:hypothetical protein
VSQRRRSNNSTRLCQLRQTKETRKPQSWGLQLYLPDVQLRARRLLLRGFICTNSYVRCGTNCINPATQVCSSGAPAPKTRRSLRACSPRSKICPIGRIGWECIDTQNSLESCGGCPNAGGQDCSVLPGADQVACVDGACRISSCIRGQSLALDGTCVRD